MNPMVDEVNKIVYNLLAAEHAVHIPSVGSLLVERIPAKRLSKRRIVPPYYAVIFTSHAVGVCLTDAIARAAGCDAAAAREICDRWLERTMQEGVLSIERVGLLRQKSFSVDPVFDKVINPQERTPMAVRPSESHWLFWTVSSIAIVCGIGACGWILYDRMANERYPAPLESRVETIVQREPEVPAAADSSALALQNPVAETTGPVSGMQDGDTASGVQNGSTTSRMQTANEGAAKVGNGAGGQTATGTSPVGRQTPDAAASLSAERMIPGCNYVVLGVFSTEQNAQRAAKEAMAADASLWCGVWNYGNKFMVSLFASDDAAACAEFVRTHTDRYPEVWSYKAK